VFNLRWIFFLLEELQDLDAPQAKHGNNKRIRWEIFDENAKTVAKGSFDYDPNILGEGIAPDDILVASLGLENTLEKISEGEYGVVWRIRD
jgi:hypothetical protein